VALPPQANLGAVDQAQILYYRRPPFPIMSELPRR